MLRRTMTVLVALVAAAAMLAPAAGARSLITADPTVDRPAHPDPRVAPVALHCTARVAEGVGVVPCRWRTGADVAVRSWQLWKAQVRPEPGPRTLVAELGADRHGYVDTHVEVPAVYVYAVLGLNGAGEIVARSRVVSVTVAERHDRLEALRLECGLRDDRAIGCGWTAASRPGAVGYQLWRAVDGSRPGVIARLGLDGLRYHDADVAPGHRYTYLVRAVDADGRTVAISERVTVDIRPPAEIRESDRVADRDVIRDHKAPDGRDAVRERDGLGDRQPSGDVRLDRHRPERTGS